MAANRQSTTLEIKGLVASSLLSATATTKEKLASLKDEVKRLKKESKGIESDIAAGIKAGINVAPLQAKFESLKSSMGSVGAKARALKVDLDFDKALTRVGDMAKNAAIGMGVAGGAMAMAVSKPIKAFEDLDKATTSATMAFMMRDGLPAQFDKILAKSIEISNQLPGTSADFIEVATALRQNVVSPEMILGGALEASSHLGFIMNMIPKDAAKMTAILRESFGLSEHEFEKMANYAQKANAAFGLTADDLMLGAQYYGSKLNALGLTGAENFRKVMAIQGQAKISGIHGSTFGTNFGALLTRASTLDFRRAKKSPEIQAINDELKKAKIELAFFDKQGKFAGIDNLVGQLTLLKKLQPKQTFHVLTKMFGEEGARVAGVIVANGDKGYAHALEVADQQAEISAKIAVGTATFSAQLEAMRGTSTSTLASIGESTGKALTPLITSINNFMAGPMQSWVRSHGPLIRVAGLTAIALAGVLTVGAALSTTIWAGTFAVKGYAVAYGGMSRFVSLSSTAMRTVVSGSFRMIGLSARIGAGMVRGAARLTVGAFRLMASAAVLTAKSPLYAYRALRTGILLTRLAALRGFTSIRALAIASGGFAGIAKMGGQSALSFGRGIMSFGGAIRGFVIRAIPMMIGGLQSLTVALMTNPIGLIIGGIAIAAGLIYVYWEPIKKFSIELWGKVSSIVSETWTSIKEWLGWDPLESIAELWQPVSGFFRGMWEEVASYFEASIKWIKEKLGKLIEWWDEAMESMGFGDGESLSLDMGDELGLDLKVAPELDKDAAEKAKREYEAIMGEGGLIDPNAQSDIPSYGKKGKKGKGKGHNLPMVSPLSSAHATIAELPMVRDAASFKQTNVADHSKYEITIVRDNHDDDESLIAKLMRKLDERQERGRRRLLFDSPG